MALQCRDRPPTLAIGRGRRYTAVMGDAPDLASLAKRYIDLWQEQMIAVAADPDLAEAFARLMSLLLPTGWAARTDGAGREHGGADATAPRTAAAPDPSRERGDGLDEFARRLAALERRIAALEKGPRAGRKRAASRARRRRS